MKEIAEKLDNINKTLEGILQALNKPENKFMVILAGIGAVVSALGILGTIDLIRSWIIGE